MKTIQAFVKQNKIKCTATWHHENPNMPESQNMDHWKTVLKFRDHQMTVYFSKGYGHNGKPPNAEEVLSCLASDANGSDQDFESWAADLGYDPDSRRAERIHKTICRQAGKLQDLLGDECYNELLYEVEPD